MIRSDSKRHIEGEGAVVSAPFWKLTFNHSHSEPDEDERTVTLKGELLGVWMQPCSFLDEASMACPLIFPSEVSSAAKHKIKDTEIHTYVIKLIVISV